MGRMEAPRYRRKAIVIRIKRCGNQYFVTGSQIAVKAKSKELGTTGSNSDMVESEF